jgi:threonine/homoserine/homoserine lactone efflux protein
MWTYISFGAILGLSAGVAPGPLSTLVISQTLQHNVSEGVRVGVAPLLTDLPIILLGLLLFSSLPAPNFALGVVSFIGCVFLMYLGISGLRQQPVELELPATLPRSYLKGALVNALSPHPYLFWFTVGAPTVLKAYSESLAGALGFLFAFYVSLVGAKVGIALLVGKSRQFLAGPAYIWTTRFLGVVLIVFSFSLLYDGLLLTGIISRDG